jgi:LPXTG-site transpeptidase (sortase) family protein
MVIVVAILVSAIGLGAMASPAVDAAPVAASTPSTSSFTALDPVRVLGAAAPAPLTAGRIQYLTVAGRHGAPAVVAAARLVVTFSPAVAGVELRVHASGTTPPLVPTLVAGAVGEPLVRSITVPVGANGQVEFRPTGAGVMTVDLIGVYTSTASSSAGRLQVTDPIRVTEVADARRVDVALPAAVPSDAAAVLLAVTAWNSSTLGSWSTPEGTPVVMAIPGRIGANEIVVRPTSGRIVLSGSASTRIAVDVIGWFTGSSTANGSDGLYVVAPPTRLVDTVSAPNPLGAGVALHARWTLETSVAPFGSARAVVAQVGVNTHAAGSVSLHAAGRTRPTYGQVQAARAGVRDTMHATVPTSVRGVAAYSSAGTDLVLDVIGWFTGGAAPAPSARPVNVMPAGENFPGLLVVPRIRLTTWVLDDTDLVDIDPSHLPESRTPNQPGNTALFGHRTSKGREFRNIDRIRLGDPIHLAVQGKIYTYSATNVEVLSPDDPRLYASSSNEQTITLVACHPPGSVKWRIVVFGRLQSVTSF